MLNENHDAELIAGVGRERATLGRERKAEPTIGELKSVAPKVKDETKAALKAKTLYFHQELDWQLEQKDADRIQLGSEKKSLERVVQQCKEEIEERRTKESLDAALFSEIAKQIADMVAKNTRLKVCAENSTADKDRMRVAVHQTLNHVGGTGCETPRTKETQG